MTATELAQDPTWILERLPSERDREWFLQQYRESARAAAEDPERYADLRRLLHQWQLRAVARSSTSYEESREQARTGEGVTTTLEEVIARRKAM